MSVAGHSKTELAATEHMEVKGVGRGIAMTTDGSRAVAIPDSRPVGREERQVQEPKQKPKCE